MADMKDVVISKKSDQSLSRVQCQIVTFISKQYCEYHFGWNYSINCFQKPNSDQAEATCTRRLWSTICTDMYSDLHCIIFTITVLYSQVLD